MTNGGKIKEIFPNVTIESQGKVTTSICIDSSDVPTHFYTDWWNAEYKEPADKIKCKVCDEYVDAKYFSCPHCGAKLRRVEK